nr:AAA family ATPase [Candidatus Njordarchaeota archaeon]
MKMISNVEMKNFKSLKDVDVSLRKFNVIIGPNASGKSNFLDSLIFLSQTTNRSIDEALNQRGGYYRVVFGGQEAEIQFSVEFTLEKQAHNYRLAFTRQNITSEALLPSVMQPGVDSSHIEVPMEDGRYIGLERKWPASALFLHGHRLPLRRFREYLSSWRLYSFSTSAMRPPVQARRDFDLSFNGANLAQVLLSMRTERLKLFSQVENILKQGIPEIEELLAPLDEAGQTHLGVRVKGFEDYQFDHYQLSDGTLRLLAYIVAVTSVEPKLVCFEEPENFVHPRLLELLVEILKKSDKQVILSTHSPYLLDYVEPEDVIIFEKKEKATMVKRIKNMELIKKHLAEIGLGELWYSGEVGGVP